MTRRQLLLGLSAAALAPALPPLPVAALTMAPPRVPTSALLTFIVGTPGEFDWRVQLAESAEHAFRLRFGDDYFEDGDPSIDLNEHVTRMSRWDGTPEKDITPAMWLRAGMRYCCTRCGNETYSEEGGLAVGEEAICKDCLTFTEKLVFDEDNVVELLADMIYDVGEAAAREWLEEEEQWDLAPTERPKALALAARS